jgi:hypothetical protein
VCVRNLGTEERIGKTSHCSSVSMHVELKFACFQLCSSVTLSPATGERSDFPPLRDRWQYQPRRIRDTKGAMNVNDELNKMWELPWPI